MNIRSGIRDNGLYIASFRFRRKVQQTAGSSWTSKVKAGWSTPGRGQTSTDDQGFGNDDIATAASPEAAVPEPAVPPVIFAAAVRVFAATAASAAGASAPVAASWPR